MIPCSIAGRYAGKNSTSHKNFSHDADTKTAQTAAASNAMGGRMSLLHWDWDNLKQLQWRQLCNLPWQLTQSVIKLKDASSPSLLRRFKWWT
jgi:hypothetical protein